MAKKLDLPDGWKWTTLGDTTRPMQKRVKPQDFPNLPYIGMENIEPHTMRLLGTVPSLQMKSTSESFEAGDVLYGRLRPYLNKVFSPDFVGLCSTEFIVFRKTPNLYHKYLQYFLNSWEFTTYANSLNAGDRPRVKFEQFANYPFPLPPLDKQERIVAKIEELFTQLDAGTAALKRVQAGLKRYKASVLKAAFMGCLLKSEVKSISSEDELPNGWKWVELSEIARTTSGGTPLRNHNEFYGGNIPWIKSGELRDKYITQSEEYITNLGLINSSAKIFPKNTVVVALYGATVGRTGILNIDAATNQAVCAIFPKNQEFAPLYMFYWLQFNRTNLIKKSIGGAQPNISQGILNSLIFPLAPLLEQQQIAAEVEQRMSVIQKIEQIIGSELARSHRLRKAILKQAFEGKLVN